MHFRFTRLISFGLALACLTATAFAQDKNAPPADPAPSLQEKSIGLERAFDIRHDLVWLEKDRAAAFAFLEKEFAKDPRPHVKARYGEYLAAGKDWGAPEGQQARGVALINEAYAEDKLAAAEVMGRMLYSGIGGPRNNGKGMILLMRAADQNLSPTAMVAMGEIYLERIRTAPVMPEVAEKWFRKAAYAGRPGPLFTLGLGYANGDYDPKPRDIPKAAALIHEAAIQGSGKAWDYLKENGPKPDTAPEIRRAYQLSLLWFASLGMDNVRYPDVKAAAKELAATYPEDPVVLTELGRLYRSGRFTFSNYRKAWAFLDKAASLGSADARAERARMLMDGNGVKKNPEAALAEWRELEKQNHPGTLALIGYYHYWGSLKGIGLPKDAVLAYAYSKRAADAGDFFGQANTAICYEHGIGVETDYAMASYYCLSAALRGNVRAKEFLPRLVSHVLAER